MAYQQTELEELWMRMQQFLVHSYLYYELDENIIDDHRYDRMCVRLVELLNKYPEEYSKLPYSEIIGDGGGGSGSGSYIPDYPPQIQTTALRLLWHDKKKTIEGFNESFPDFIGRWGRTVIGWKKIDGEWKYIGEEEKPKVKKVVSPKKKKK
jgi:hypothetical protein